MDLATVFAAIKTHAVAAAAAVDATWKDIEIAPPLPRGKCVRLFYGGEREPVHFDGNEVLNAELVAQAVTLRAFWPVADYAKARRRNLMYEMAAWSKELRTRIRGDSTLGGACTDLTVSLADPDDILFGTVHYAIVDTEVLVEYDEFFIAA